MPWPKVVFITRFEVPTEPALCRWPEHKVQHGFTTDGVRSHAECCRVNPLRSNASHELRFFRERPRFLEKKVEVPFCRVTPKERRDSRLKLQPILYRRNFNSDGGAEARSAFRDAPVCCASQLHNGSGLLDRLGKGVSRIEKQRRQQYGFRRVHSVSLLGSDLRHQELQYLKLAYLVLKTKAARFLVALPSALGEDSPRSGTQSPP